MKTKYNIPTRFSSTSVSPWHRIKVHDTSRVWAESGGCYRQRIFTAALSHGRIKSWHSLRSLPQVVGMWLAVLRRRRIENTGRTPSYCLHLSSRGNGRSETINAGPIHPLTQQARVSRDKVSPSHPSCHTKGPSELADVMYRQLYGRVLSHPVYHFGIHGSSTSASPFNRLIFNTS